MGEGIRLQAIAISVFQAAQKSLRIIKSYDITLSK